MRMSLASITDHGNRLPVQHSKIAIFLIIDICHFLFLHILLFGFYVFILIFQISYVADPSPKAGDPRPCQLQYFITFQQTDKRFYL